ncbi:MAG: outer membrane lipoprotein carrier protein LolA [Myxococcota bacterium]|jgi:outer membrane lipoprotein carrier protein|nr:outer membrane lipoprotein carrier protein LolA [Myxococcota bacterium]
MSWTKAAVVVLLMACTSELMAQEAAQEPFVDPIKLMANVQAYYDDAKSFSGDFEQTYVTLDGIEKKSSGTVWFKKPGLMRWDYSTPEERYLISDGKTFWSWEPVYRQYCEQSLASSQLPTALSFLVGEGSLQKEYLYWVSGSANGKHTMALAPFVPSPHYTKLELIIEAESNRVDGVVIYDAMGNLNTIQFSKVEINGVMDEANFSFSPPEDAQEICK